MARLTEKQRVFADLVAIGTTNGEAFRNAYPVKRTFDARFVSDPDNPEAKPVKQRFETTKDERTATYCRRKGFDIYHKPHVKAEIERLRQMHDESFLVVKGVKQELLMEVVRSGMRTIWDAQGNRVAENLSASHSAIKTLAQMDGELINKVEADITPAQALQEFLLSRAD